MPYPKHHLKNASIIMRLILSLLKLFFSKKDKSFRSNSAKRVQTKPEIKPATTLSYKEQSEKIQLLRLKSAESAARYSESLKRKDKFNFLYSSFTCLISAVVSFLIYYYSIISTAYLSGIPIELEHLRFRYLLGPGASQYTRFSIIIVFFSGPVASLFLSIVSFLVFRKTHPSRRFLRYLTLWMMVFGANYFFGSIISGIITRTETVYATQWVMLNPAYDLTELFLILVSLFLMILMGYLVSPMFAAASIGKSNFNTGQALYSPFLEIIAPWLLSIILLFVLNWPDYYLPLIIRSFLTVIILIPVSLKIKSIPVKRLWKYGVYQI